jgi:threonine/homoserine/homoserine lactone efflux protein
MRVVNTEAAAPRKARVAWAVAAGVALPLLIGIFYIAYSLLRRLSPASSALVIIAGIGGLAYLVVSFLKSREKNIPARPKRT